MRQVTHGPHEDSGPRWSPDGRMLTFIRGSLSFITPGQVYVKMLPSGEPVWHQADGATVVPPFRPDVGNLALTVPPFSPFPRR